MRLPALRTLSTPLLLCATLLSLQLLRPAAAESSVPSSAHPLLGIWVLSLPSLRCAETYHFRGDGTTLVKSAGEVSESEFTITEKPSAKGFYKLDDRIVKDNGKQDCSGEVMKPGTHAINYIRFHPSGARFVMCRDESMQTCIGPFERKPAEGI
jgi:hypothetical protein